MVGIYREHWGNTSGDRPSDRRGDILQFKFKKGEEMIYLLKKGKKCVLGMAFIMMVIVIRGNARAEWKLVGSHKILTGEQYGEFEYKSSEDQDESYGSFVVISDIHSAYKLPTPSGYALENIVNWVNAHKDEYKIKFVLLLGDITDKGHGGCFTTYDPSGDKTYGKLEEALYNLQVPWIPVRGNHDIFFEEYVSDEEVIYGSRCCETAFYDILRYRYPVGHFTDWSQVDGYPCGIYGVQDPNLQDYYYFANGGFGINFPQTNEKWYFVYLDCCSRASGGSASLYDWTVEGKHGTFNFLTNYYLPKIHANMGEDRVIVFSHHPPKMPYLTLNESIQVSWKLGGWKSEIGLWLCGHEHLWVPDKLLAYNGSVCPLWTVANLSRENYGFSGSFGLFKFMWEGSGGGTGPNWPRGPGACPYLYVWDGSQFQEDNSVIPASQIGWTRQDPYTLTVPLVPKDGHYVLRIKEEGNAISYLMQSD